ncbi:MAG: putative glycoside hydrolase [Patescibacteria group bacterium]|nr:putative glycoside hydrolase [Patescibacteria group bacterium]
MAMALLVKSMLGLALILLPLFGNLDFFSSTIVLHKPDKIENRGIYVTAYTAGSKDKRAALVNLIERSELNSIVIDLKDYSGLIFFQSNVPLVNKIGAADIRISDLKDWLADLKKRNIYTIGRIVVFQDPKLAEKMPEIALKSKSGGIWRDFKGLSWVDPTNIIVWKYNLDIAKSAARLGFDEINFDYVRFPSDGDIKNIVYSNLDNNDHKSQIMAAFYKYVDDSMKFEPVLTSADLFGMVLWRSDGLNIGQRYEDAANHFDYICPMVYPSHYPAGFQNFSNPAVHPYDVIYKSLIRAKDLVPKPRADLRPWIQVFNLGAVYTPEMVKAEKQAVYDSNSNGWLMWNATNRYKEEDLTIE